MTANKQVFSIKAVPSFRDTSGKWTKAHKALLEEHRNIIRPQAKRLVMLMQEEAPKKTGEFAENIRYRTFVQDNAVGFSVSTPQPLGKWIIGGTKPHKIVARRANFLAFKWAKGPRGSGMYYFKSVNHPGTKPNRFPGRAYRRWYPGMKADFDRVSNNFVRTIAGAREGTK